jgi:hypothetical protein
MRIANQRDGQERVCETRTRSEQAGFAGEKEA